MRGTLTTALRAREAKRSLVVPEDNAKEGILANGTTILPAPVSGHVQSSMTGPKHLGGTAVTLHLNVADADAAAAKAVAAGARVIMPVADQFWGDRYGVIEDPLGHRWSIATPGKNAPRTSEELLAAMNNAAPM
ncbi:MAG: VOC family protein [Acidobacteriales bacterium]|nr:VOC family protein [Terriglobales bacterium]